MNIIQNIPQGENGKWYVYIILCNNGSLYKGFTDDLERRYYQHLTGAGAKYTKQHKPIGLVYFEEYDKKEDAAAREKYFKSGTGREWLKNKLVGDIQ
ncbi:GIY-YIG nuclease family protein [Pelotomaculum propionicicum]|uniref:GIY-YIG domain-containing protein n=1 Tax=Pelotomaculum propionicicum TaxID=258475 RepID=A0A4Y7RUK8_9FIRM|nr:GIY-YIG nuclease family protein [Pelotomaculum propionicicum]TEB12436.1 hypothetical protein Pmgp_01053 [Pelotomaculum propionicicum]